MLSHHLNRYYGLICASRSLPPLYEFDDGSYPLREGPHFIPRVCVNVPPSLPRQTKWVHLAVASPPVQAFTVSVPVRHPHSPRTSVPTRLYFEAAKFALCCGPLTGSPFTDKDFYSRACTSGVASQRCRV